MISDNRVYHNSNVGIAAYGGGTLSGNTVYSNSIGIYTTNVYGYYSVQIANNLVYANLNEGIELNLAGNGTQLVNNTVYQRAGDAVLVQGGGGRAAAQQHPVG